MKAQLFILGGRDVGRSFDVEEQAVLGRAPECDVRLRDRSISRKHAVVRATDEGWVVEDLGSRNGITFRGERVPDARLQDHDEFELGDLPVRIRVGGAPGDPETAPPPLAAAVPPVTSGTAEPGGEDEIQLEEEITLEDEIELGKEVETVMTTAPHPGPTRAPVRLEPEPPAPAPDAPELSDYERRRAQILREGKRGGFLRGDLSQQPFWVRLVLGVLLTAMAVGLMLLAFWTMQKLRGSL